MKSRRSVRMTARSLRNHLYKDGYWSGWSEYRYGPSAPRQVSVAPVFRGEKRKSVINQAIDVLRDWRFSPFEHEAVTCHGIRTALCLGGIGWARADYEARSITAAALNFLGAERPKWDQGQPQYTEVRENCKWCSRPLPAEAFLGKRRHEYCSAECARSAFVHRAFDLRTQENRAYRAAQSIVRRDRNESRICEVCGDRFKPVSAKSRQRFCSQICKGKAFRTVPHKECMNCKRSFRGARDQVYCSLECSRSGRATARYDACCLWCGSPFKAESPRAEFCCKNHQQRLYRLPVQIATGRVKTLSPPVFDYLFTRHRRTAARRDLTPALFDRLFREAA